jgi:hypothetical protein
MPKIITPIISKKIIKGTKVCGPAISALVNEKKVKGTPIIIKIIANVFLIVLPVDFTVF